MKYRVIKVNNDCYDIQYPAMLWGWTTITTCYTLEEAKQWLDALELGIERSEHPEVVYETIIPKEIK